MFDDQDREDELIIGDWRAAIRFKQISAAWNGRLFVQIAVNSRDDKSPCYAAPVAPSGAQEPVGYADQEEAAVITENLGPSSPDVGDGND